MIARSGRDWGGLFPISVFQRFRFSAFAFMAFRLFVAEPRDRKRWVSAVCNRVENGWIRVVAGCNNVGNEWIGVVAGCNNVENGWIGVVADCNNVENGWIGVVAGCNKVENEWIGVIAGCNNVENGWIGVVAARKKPHLSMEPDKNQSFIPKP